jgi:hypothetical protein
LIFYTVMLELGQERKLGMKKVLLGLLAGIVVLGLFAAAGYAGYRFGYAQGVQTSANGNATRPQPRLRPFDDFGRRGMPMHPFGFERGFRRSGFPMMGFWFFGPLRFFGSILVLALVVWFIYWLVARSGWRLTRQPAETPPPAETRQASEVNSSKIENE